MPDDKSIGARIEEVCERFELALQRGESADISTFVSGFEESEKQQAAGGIPMWKMPKL